ncbi:MAG: hypothetical protein WC796_00940 [Candidatus Pacearchaeota archaeon]|jgi:hypothetical protein
MVKNVNSFGGKRWTIIIVIIVVVIIIGIISVGLAIKVSQNNNGLYNCVDSTGKTFESNEPCNNLTIDSVIICNNDSECYASSQNYCYNNSACEVYNYCENPATVSSKCVNVNNSNSCVFCPYGCLDGKCINTIPNCTDSDGGINLKIKGDSRGLSENGSIFSDSDYCTWRTNNSDDPIMSCFGVNCSLWEYYCVTEKVLTKYPYNCPTGCIDGRCR